MIFITWFQFILFVVSPLIFVVLYFFFVFMHLVYKIIYLYVSIMCYIFKSSLAATRNNVVVLNVFKFHVISLVFAFENSPICLVWYKYMEPDWMPFRCLVEIAFQNSSCTHKHTRSHSHFITHTFVYGNGYHHTCIRAYARTYKHNHWFEDEHQKTAGKCYEVIIELNPANHYHYYYLVYNCLYEECMLLT